MTKQKLTLAEKSWIMYDVGNSALVLLATSVIPIYFSSLAPDGGVVVAWSYAETIASLIIALLMPILGSIADMQGMKKKFIVGCVGTGVVATIALGFPTSAAAFLVIYVISSVALNSSMVFYDALLVDTTTDERMDEVSSQGYAWGYIGSCVPFIACLLVVLNYEALGMSLQTAMKIAFFITAAWWLAFTIPMLKNVEQKHFKPREAHAFSNAIKGIGNTLREMWSNAAIKYYMIAYFFYIDGVHTIIKLSTSYGTDLGISSTQLVLALLVTQFVAFPSAIIYGRLSSKYGTRRMLLIAIAAYFGITLFASFFLRSAAEFWVLAILVGMFQGGIQALSRSEFGKLCPKERANEYFGFFDIFGKYAAILGTFLVGTLTALTGNSSLGVLSIAILFVVGFVLMLKVPEREDGAEA
ncbi:MFS transporter [Paratractidigestivibacter sp.]|uniref:MFS transporter n=1 Tax=Paratractidigestivibacter sp. TaxID=2847316 RepID=UPI002ABD94A2|nr:MFS transporter [Paratractidigestivibacter sp.]